MRDMHRPGAGRRDGAAAAGVQAPVPRRVHRHVAAVALHVPHLPRRRRRRAVVSAAGLNDWLAGLRPPSEVRAVPYRDGVACKL